MCVQITVADKSQCARAFFTNLMVVLSRIESVASLTVISASVYYVTT